MISREEAIAYVNKHVKNSNLTKHMVAVSAIMHGLAVELGEDAVLWELVGLLHDIDYEEVTDDFDQHGIRSAKILEGLIPK